MDANELHKMEAAAVERRYREIMVEAGEMVADGRLADDLAAAEWITAQQDRINRNPWG